MSLEWSTKSYTITSFRNLLRFKELKKKKNIKAAVRIQARIVTRSVKQFMTHVRICILGLEQENTSDFLINEISAESKCFCDFKNFSAFFLLPVILIKFYKNKGINAFLYEYKPHDNYFNRKRTNNAKKIIAK